MSVKSLLVGLMIAMTPTVWGLVRIYNTHEFLKIAQVAQGNVVRAVDQGPMSDTGQSFSYTYRVGEKEYQGWRSGNSYSGEAIAVLYDPNDPSVSQPRGFEYQWQFSVILLLTGLFFAIILMGALVPKKKRRPMSKDL